MANKPKQLVGKDQAPKFPVETFEAMQDVIILQLPEEKKETKGGILLTDDARESAITNVDQLFKVMKVGPAVQDKRITEGSYVLAEHMTLLPLMVLVDSKEVFVSIVREHNVILVFNGDKLDQMKRLADVKESLKM